MSAFVLADQVGIEQFIEGSRHFVVRLTPIRDHQEIDLLGVLGTEPTVIAGVRDHPCIK